MSKVSKIYDSTIKRVEMGKGKEEAQRRHVKSEWKYPAPDVTMILPNGKKLTVPADEYKRKGKKLWEEAVKSIEEKKEVE